MKERDVVLILLAILVLIVLLRKPRWLEDVTSRWYTGAPGEKPPWEGKIGDVVRWGDKVWAWTVWYEAPEGDWVEIRQAA